MASRYFKSGATVWNNANNWSSTSAAGVDNAGIPTAADDAIFTSGSGSACAVTTTAGVCLSLTTTGYTGTITLNTTVTVSGNITLGASTVFSGASALICNAMRRQTGDDVFENASNRIASRKSPLAASHMPKHGRVFHKDSS
jgi:hypothetical protein